MFTDPTDASSWPTGNPEIPKSEADLVIAKEETLSDMSTESLGDISIRSKVESKTFIVSTTILSPLRNTISLSSVC